MDSKEILDGISSAQRYLQEQVDLFGNTIYVDMKEKKQDPPGGTAVGATLSAAALPDEPWSASGSLSELNESICTCLKCPLGNTRTKFVFGTGTTKADVMFIGEAPGADEDKQGEPFVGRAGQLLNKIIEAVGMKREDVYICNILKCRPPNNREPLPSEMETCTPYLAKQIDLLKPKFIIALGRISAQWLLHSSESLTAMRGKVHEYRGARLIVTYHPAALLRNPNWKRPAWDDMKMFKQLYDESKEA